MTELATRDVTHLLKTRDCQRPNCPEQAEPGSDYCRRHRASGGRLGELAERATYEHRRSRERLAESIEHGINCGHALLEARRLVDTLPVTWADWLRENVGISSRYAYGYMRLAHYRDELPEEAFGPYVDARGRNRQPSVARAIRYADGLPAIADKTRRSRFDDETRQEIIRLREQGVGIGEIARRLSISRSSAFRVGDPEREKAHRARSNVVRGVRTQKEQAETAAARAARLAEAIGDDANLTAAHSHAVELVATLRALDGDRWRLPLRYANHTRRAIERAILDEPEGTVTP